MASAKVVNEWDELLEQADFTAGGDVHKRKYPFVEVPAAALTLVEKARNQATPRFTLPVKSVEDYNNKTIVLYNAGQKLDPVSTVLVVPGIVAAGKFTKVEDVADATHLRATVGAKRGTRGKAKDDTPTAE